MKQNQQLIIIIVFSIFGFSCTLNYEKDVKKFDKMPNFIFKNSSLDRYEDNKLSLKINFKNLEIYDSDKIWAGDEIYFTKIKTDKSNKINKEKIESKGFAGIIKIDEKNNKYFLGKKVFFEDAIENIIISGNAFFWNKENNMLYAPNKSIISVQKGTEFNIKGSGFISNTLSREFEFINSITGTIQTNDKTENQEKQDDNKK